MVINVSVDIESYNKDIQSSTVNSVVRIVGSFVGDKHKLSFLPTKRKVWTVNRSPHIFKKSREQFEQRKYKACVSCLCGSLGSSLSLLNILYSQEYLGVGLKARVAFSTAVPSYS